MQEPYDFQFFLSMLTYLVSANNAPGFFLKEKSELFIRLLLLVFLKDGKLVNPFLPKIFLQFEIKSRLKRLFIKLSGSQNRPLQLIVASAITFKKK